VEAVVVVSGTTLSTTATALIAALLAKAYLFNHLIIRPLARG